MGQAAMGQAAMGQAVRSVPPHGIREGSFRVSPSTAKVP